VSTVSPTVHPEVAAALASSRPVVALESTIISHGMPYPDNMAMARDVEAVVRAHGAVPATIALLDGRPCIGLADDQLERLARSAGVHKATTRDLPWLVAGGATGATTVAATMWLAHLAGIEVFATGGIGGVHRGASVTFDVSADLLELARTPVAVVCAGVKSILDIGATLEQLETLGVPVLVDGSDEFPSFYSRVSGHPAPRRLDGAAAIARFLRAARELGLPGGAVIANPISPADEIPAQEIAGIIDAALAQADHAGVRGREVTPWLLSRIVDATDGRSLTANIALVRDNARLAAEVAVALAGAPTSPR
jgi:pseudouridine-5'-phosphate glycosidase